LLGAPTIAHQQWRPLHDKFVASFNFFWFLHQYELIGHLLSEAVQSADIPTDKGFCILFFFWYLWTRVMPKETSVLRIISPTLPSTRGFMGKLGKHTHSGLRAFSSAAPGTCCEGKRSVLRFLGQPSVDETSHTHAEKPTSSRWHTPKSARTFFQ